MLRSTSTYIETLGTNTGFIDVYDVDGNFLQRAITGGNLNAPWGMALAPPTFGIYGGDLLVGNLGDGLINVYDPSTFAYLGQIIDGTGSPILASLPTGSTASGGGTSPYAASTGTSGYTGLWEIVFGTGTATSTPSSSLVGDSNTLYFAAGLASETHGLFGSIAPSASATGTPGFGLSTSTQIVPVAAGQSDAITVSVEPVNGFSGTVSLACSGLPAGATCSFSPATVTASATASATTELTIQTASQSALGKVLNVFRSHSTGISSAMLLPLGAFALLGRRRRAMANYMRILGAGMLLFVGITAVIGCGGNSATPTPTPNPGTPAGTSQVTITATAGSVSHTTTLSLAVQ
jgi:hypothetical protein